MDYQTTINRKISTFSTIAPPKFWNFLTKILPFKIKLFNFFILNKINQNSSILDPSRFAAKIISQRLTSVVNL